MRSSRGLTPGLIVVLGSLMTVNPLAAHLYLPALGALVADLDTTVAGGQLVYTGFLIGVAGGQLIVGMLSDVVGRRPVLLCGLVLVTLASLLAAFAPTIGTLVATRVAQGLGAAAVVVVARAVVADTATGRTAARAYSILMGLLAAGPFAAPLLGTLAFTVGGWRAGFVLLTVLCTAGLVVAWALVPETLAPDRRSAARIGTMVGNYGRLLRDPAYIGNALAMSFGYAALAVHSAASSFVAQDILHTGPWGYAAIYTGYAAAVLVGSMGNAFFAGRVGAARMMAIAQTIALAATLTLLAFTLWGPFTIASFLPTVLVGGAAASAILSNASALTLARAGFAAASGAALMGSVQYAVAAAVVPVGGILGSGTAFPMAAGMVGCLLLSAGCAWFGHRAGLRRGPEAPGGVSRRGDARNRNRPAIPVG